MPTDTNTALVDAISLLQKAQATLEEAIKSINDHNIATDSHMDIRNILDTILNGDAIYTRDQIIDLGVFKDNIEISSLNTYDKDFYSYRRDGVQVGRMLTVGVIL